MNEKIFEYYDKLSQNATTPLVVRNKAKDSTEYDVEFLKKYADKNQTLLDLGSGTGLTINNLKNDFKNIIAVEKYKEFYKFIDKDIQIIEQNILDFNFDIEFDIISIFGVLPYFSYEEAKQLYTNIYNSFSGKIIVKNQFGVSEDVTVDGYSEELDTYYFSQYRHLDKEIKLLESIGFKIEEVVDIYPNKYNRWENTHFYALVFKKAS